MSGHSIQIDFQVNNAALKSGLRESVDAVRQLGTQMDGLKSRTVEWGNAGKALGTTFAQSLRGMLQGTQTFSQAWQGMLAGTANKFRESLATMLAQWVQHHAMRSLVHATANQADVASDAAAGLQKRQISLAETLKQVTHAAIKAAANAYNAVVGIPIVGPVLAPPAAAVAFAGVEAFGALASAAGGWGVVPQDQLAFVHKNEMVLPAALAERVRDMSAGAGQVHIHTGGNSFSATDAQGMERLLREHEKAIVRTVRRLARNGSLRGV